MAVVRIFVAGIIASLLMSASAQASACNGKPDSAALAACINRLNANPQDRDARTLAVTTLMGMERYQEAITLLEEGLALAPDDDMEERLVVAKNLREEQLYMEKYQARISSATAQAGGTSVQLNKIRCMTLQGDRALQACDDWLKIGGPEEATIQKRKGDLLLAAGNRSAAAAAFRKAVALDPALSRNAEIAGLLQPPVAPARTVSTPQRSAQQKPSQQSSIRAPAPARTVAAALPKPAPVQREVPKQAQVAAAKTYSNAAISSGVTF